MLQAPAFGAPLDLQHLLAFQGRQTRMCQIEGYGDPRYAVRREPFVGKPIMWAKAQPAILEVLVQPLDSLFENRPLDGQTEVAYPPSKQLVVGQISPGRLSAPTAAQGLAATGVLATTWLHDLFDHSPTTDLAGWRTGPHYAERRGGNSPANSMLKSTILWGACRWLSARLGASAVRGPAPATARRPTIRYQIPMFRSVVTRRPFRSFGGGNRRELYRLGALASRQAGAFLDPLSAARPIKPR